MLFTEYRVIGNKTVCSLISFFRIIANREPDGRRLHEQRMTVGLQHASVLSLFIDRRQS